MPRPPEEVRLPVPTHLVIAVNALTARWLAAAGARASALTGLGVWPLLALIAEPCEGPGRAELAAAIGVEPQDAMADARAVLELAEAGDAVALATGLWTHADLVLNPDWAERLPSGTRGTVTGHADEDAAVLDAWAVERTRGRIERFPITTTEDSRLILATALVVETKWLKPFEEWVMRVTDGPWAGARGPALARRSRQLNRVRVVPTPHGPFTDVTVMGDRGVDVHLVLGPEDASPNDVLSAGVDAIAARSATLGDAFTTANPGPGIEVTRERSFESHDELTLLTIPFDLEASHDLLELPDVFGLRTVSDTTGRHFPGIGTKPPLAVGAAAQNIVARFSAEGFDAAATTGLGIAVGGVPPTPPHEITRVSVVFDRPFAYYAVDRRSGLILVAGWVGEPSRFGEFNFNDPAR